MPQLKPSQLETLANAFTENEFFVSPDTCEGMGEVADLIGPGKPYKSCTAHPQYEEFRFRALQRAVERFMFSERIKPAEMQKIDEAIAIISPKLVMGIPDVLGQGSARDLVLNMKETCYSRGICCEIADILPHVQDEVLLCSTCFASALSVVVATLCRNFRTYLLWTRLLFTPANLEETICYGWCEPAPDKYSSFSLARALLGER